MKKTVALGWLVAMVGLGSSPATSSAASSAADARPNVVVILADDMGFSDLGSYGGEIETPILDGLAANGLRFTQFYNTGRCWPSRAAFLTGYYAQQVNRDPAKRRPEWATLLPELLRTSGYRTYHSGKWHVDGPVLAGGFERSYLVTDHDRNFNPREHFVDDRPVPLPKAEDHYYSTKAIAEHGVSWLAEHEKAHKDEPFFLYIAFTAPHFPLQAPAEDVARYRDRYQVGWDVIRDRRWNRIKQLGIVDGALPAYDPKTLPGWNLSEEELHARIGPGETGVVGPWDALTDEQKRFQTAKMAVHAAMVDRMDRGIGLVVDRLKAMGAFENTLILFMSDNGASAEQMIRGDGHDPKAEPGAARSFLGLGPGWATVSNTPFRLYKVWNHEGGISTPLIAHWPKGIAARGELRRTPGHLVDLAPTIFELARITPPDSYHGEPRPPLPGRSLVPAFAHDVTVPHDFLFFKHEGNRALRAGDWKIVSNGPAGAWELYNLAVDRTETHNLAADQPDRLKALVAIWERQDREYQTQGATGKR
ncbi:arylsulfatase [Paludisphaera borealis]|nr:arylsulfatase [Paludisphaera borealis]